MILHCHATDSTVGESRVVFTTMSRERASSPGGRKGLLRGSRSKSYGSLIRSPVLQRLEHPVQPGETLPGLALRYGVSMEEIKRVNKLYTNDSIFLKKCLLIPVPSGPDGRGAPVDGGDRDGGSVQDGDSSVTRAGSASDLTPVDFLKRLDDLISRSKQAAVDGCHQAEQRVAALEAACCTGRTSDWRPLTRSQSAMSSPRIHQQGAPGVAPVATNKLAKKLRDQEDEIFEL